MYSSIIHWSDSLNWCFQVYLYFSPNFIFPQIRHNTKKLDITGKTGKKKKLFV